MELVKDAPETVEQSPETPSPQTQIEATVQIIELLTNKIIVHETALQWLSEQPHKFGRFIVIVNDIYTAFVEGKEKNVKLRDKTDTAFVSEKDAKDLCKFKIFSDRSGRKYPARGYMPFKQFHTLELELSRIAIEEYQRQLESMTN